MAVQFFVPDAIDAEAAWQSLRELCGAPASERRVYSVTFEHDQARVTAIVGERVTVERRIRRGTSRWNQYSDNLEPPRSSGGTVLAIFEGNPYLVYQRPDDDTEWENPFMVGPNSIRSYTDFARSDSAQSD